MERGAKPGAKVITIEPAQTASTVEWAVGLFSAGVWTYPPAAKG
jgi:hypothetical protein